MKTNLGSMFATDKNLETEGKWFPLADGIEFRMKRMGGFNNVEVNKLRAKYIKPHLRQMEKGLLPADVERDIYVKVFVKSCMVDWKGLSDDKGQDVEYSEGTAIELFKDTPDLFDYVVELATDVESYKAELGKS